MTERIEIDDTYTYEFDAGKVSILRHGMPWLSTETAWLGSDPTGPLNAPKAWIAAANEIEELRATVESLTRQIEADADVIYSLRSEAEHLEDLLSEAQQW